MTFKEQLAEVLNGFDITYTDNNNPDQAITEMANYGKELVLEAWKAKDNPLLLTINAVNDSLQYVIIHTHSDDLELANESQDIDEVFQNYAQAYLADIEQTLIHKNADYGSSYLQVATQLGTIPTFSVRILDKCNRLIQLHEDLETHKHRKVKDESIEDTMLDLIGYYILCIITMKFHPNLG